MPSTPVGVAMTSTSRPCLAKMPFSRAIHGGIMDADNDVNAMRSLRGLAPSAAWPELLGAVPRENAKTKIRPSLPSNRLLPTIESLGVLAQDSGFGLLRNVFSASDGRRDMG